MNTPDEHAGEHAQPTTSRPSARRARSGADAPRRPRPPVPPAPVRRPCRARPARGAAASRRPLPGAGRRRADGTWGRVADDGTVFVRTADGERPVGQMPDATPEEALAFFTRRYDDLAFEVELLEQRVKAGTLGPDEAAASVKQVHATLHGRPGRR